MGNIAYNFNAHDVEVGDLGGKVPVMWAWKRALLFSFLQTVRDRWGRVKVTSGYRPADSKSQHAVCEAVDFVCLDADRNEVWRWLLLHAEAMPLDQVIIYEDTNHLHVSTVLKPERTNRREFRVHTAAGEYTLWADYSGPLKEPA